MPVFTPLCFTFGVEQKCCPKCNASNITKSGFTTNNKQRYQCKKCNIRFICSYTYNAYKKSINQNVVALIKEGCSIRGIARLLQISTTTLLKRIVAISKTIQRPYLSYGKTYEVDELRTYCKNKQQLLWIVLGYERENKHIVTFNVGKRSNKTLGTVIATLLLSKPKQIFTDKLRNYRYLIPSYLHQTQLYGTNSIERFNLSVRTHLKRLNRRSICFSKSIILLAAVLKIYLWG
ncbi:MAG: IS1 family transposase [Bacteroidia bacterium]